MLHEKANKQTTERSKCQRPLDSFPLLKNALKEDAAVEIHTADWELYLEREACVEGECFILFQIDGW